ncbi:hypothetical protein [Leptolyngbya sp. FACHB-17]|uniref:hypothetical protein n=1 Tax=unclassified Leptolyngbya TaxID=2650499 RepID=UPI001680F176|nr:hypothetical protein [Leptolyngbya sp. FACHB-17]MBD2078792.1 hypothetical protein [Leptolyngbya sp. FACHB-17]
MARIIDRLSISMLAVFLLAATLSACSQSAKPTIKPGTVFTQTAPGSKVYREAPNDRPMITNFDAKR